VSEVIAVSPVVCASVSEGSWGEAGKTSGSPCCRITFPRAIVEASSGATGLPQFEGDHSVGVPCSCSLEVGGGVRYGELTKAPWW